jgi:hypothetical protein
MTTQNDPIQKLSPNKIRAYKQAPWREQTRLLAIGLAAIFGLMAMLGLFIFTGAQAAEAGLQVQSLIRERDRLLRRVESQELDLTQKQSEDWMRKRAKELGFVPADPNDLDYLSVPEAPPQAPVSVSPTSFLYTDQEIAMAPAFRETLLEWVLRFIRPKGGK